MEVKPIHATASAGVAVATAGLSILARGLWNRVTAEKQVCVQAMEAAERKAAH